MKVREGDRSHGFARHRGGRTTLPRSAGRLRRRHGAQPKPANDHLARGPLEERGLTQVVTTSTFPSREATDQLVNMGMENGRRAAMAQMDEITTA
jgi:hypothetical protein